MLRKFPVIGLSSELGLKFTIRHSTAISHFIINNLKSIKEKKGKNVTNRDYLEADGN